jgi:urease accessory protein
MLRATARLSADHGRGIPFDLIILAADERRVRRKLLTLMHGDEVLVDFPEAITLENRDVLVLEDGRLVEIVAADEDVYEITGRDSVHLAKLAWHLGNRHLPAQIEKHRILIARDHVIKDMLIGLGANVSELSAPFSPEHGAYHGHSHGDNAHALLNRK